MDLCLGHFDYTPHYILDEETKRITPIYIVADALDRSVKPGIKAGNFILDNLLEILRKETVIKRAKQS